MNVQPALLVANVVAYRVYMKEIGIAPHFFAGHSLGEYSALTCAGAIKFADAVKIVRERGLLTKTVMDSGIGAMTIIKGLDAKVVEEECRKISDSQKFAVVSCFNSPVQVAVTGHKEAIEILEQRILDMDDGRVTRLTGTGSVPFHSPLMQEPAAKFKRMLQSITYYPFRFPVISNVSSLPYASAENIPDMLALHLVKPVKWQETMSLFRRCGVTLAIEMGPKNVLCKLVTANTPEIDAYCYAQKEDQRILYNRLYKNGQLGKHVPTVITGCLAAAAATPNSNWDKDEYAKGVARPYKIIQNIQHELDKSGERPSRKQMTETLEMLHRIFETKKLPVKEQEEWFNQIFEETANYYEFKDFVIPGAGQERI
jgi:[acyl-carrier-protein] S-malonyltransferase